MSFLFKRRKKNSNYCTRSLQPYVANARHKQCSVFIIFFPPFFCLLIYILHSYLQFQLKNDAVNGKSNDSKSAVDGGPWPDE